MIHLAPRGVTPSPIPQSYENQNQSPNLEGAFPLLSRFTHCFFWGGCGGPKKERKRAPPPKFKKPPKRRPPPGGPGAPKTQPNPRGEPETPPGQPVLDHFKAYVTDGQPLNVTVLLQDQFDTVPVP